MPVPWHPSQRLPRIRPVALQAAHLIDTSPSTTPFPWQTAQRNTVSVSVFKIGSHLRAMNPHDFKVPHSQSMSVRHRTVSAGHEKVATPTEAKGRVNLA
jgi:hypothetical protein